MQHHNKARYIQILLHNDKQTNRETEGQNRVNIFEIVPICSAMWVLLIPNINLYKNTFFLDTFIRSLGNEIQEQGIVIEKFKKERKQLQESLNKFLEDVEM